jgi:ADP-heptose:LPS heptosyltransferase
MTPSIKPAERLLILTTTSTGNNLFCTPAIHLLRKHRPDCLIDVVSLKKLSAEIFQDNPDINHLYVVNSGKQFDRLARSYSKVICLNANALKKLGKLDTPVIDPLKNDFTGHKADHILHGMAALLGVEVEDADRRYVMGVPQLATVLDSEGIGSREVVVNIHLGSGTTALHGWKFFNRQRAIEDERLWPLDHYVALGKLLKQHVAHCRIVLTGTRNEAYFAGQFLKQIPDAINLVGKTSALQLHGMMRRLNLFIAHDCGVMHIAAASEVPIVGLYAATDPAVFGPYPARAHHHVFKRDKIADISPGEVLEAAQTLLRNFSKNTGVEP